MFHFLVLQFFLKIWAKEKKKMTPFWRKKQAEEKQDNATTMISVDGKGTVFEKTYLKKRISKRSNRLNWDKLPD